MDIRFRSGKPPVVKFSKGDQDAAAKIVFLLSEYGKRMDDVETVQLSDDLGKTCTEIGLMAIVEEPKV